MRSLLLRPAPQEHHKKQRDTNFLTEPDQACRASEGSVSSWPCCNDREQSDFHNCTLSCSLRFAWEPAAQQREVLPAPRDKPPRRGEPTEQAVLRAGPGTGQLAPSSPVLPRCIAIMLISAILNAHESINQVLKFHKGAIDLLL